MTASRLSHSASSKKFRRNAVAFGVALAIASSAYANPTGMSVVAGQATAQSIGNLLQVTNTPGAILNWQQFNIDVGQTTQFIQQNAASQVFNRVTGGDVSQILGTLQSNGQVFLINPAGVFFGQGAVIDTAGFLASTLAASDMDLLNGHLKFNDANGNAGGIVNQGKLTTHSGGSIVLLAPNIENSGIVHADGEVLLAAGHSVTIVDLKHPTIGLTVAVKEGEQAVNLGQIIGKNVSLFSHLLKNSGVVEATGAQVGEGGVIRFIAKGDALVSGKVLAESTTGKGGEIDITGNRVAVLSGARISADGATGGGTVHVGGGWQGQDESLANSQQTVVQANTLISANATENGNGGEVVVWADGHTTVNSEVQAKGGALGGDGGRVETSGKESLAANVAANTSAPNGKAGQWLLDPANIAIVDAIPEGGFDLAVNSEGSFFFSDGIMADPQPTESFLLNSTVVNGLESNGFVTISTRGSSTGEGKITVDAPVLVSQNQAMVPIGPPQLNLEAQGEININAAIGLQPGQIAFSGFELNLSYDIAKPVYVNAPLYLGEFGRLNLSPYDIGTALPVNSAGQKPMDGVNLLSGMNEAGSTQPLLLNQIIVSPSFAFDETTMTGTPVFPNTSVKLNILGANLQVNNFNFVQFNPLAPTQIRVGSQNFGVANPVQGRLSYNQLFANNLSVESGSVVSTYSRVIDPMIGWIQPSGTNLDALTNSGTVNFNVGSAFISQIQADAGTINFGAPTFDFSVGSSFYNIGSINAAAESTLNISNSSFYYTSATFNGTVNLESDSFGYTTFLSGLETNLNGQLNITAGFNQVNFQVLRMGANSRLLMGADSYVGLGRFHFSPMTGPLPSPLSEAELAIASSSGGLFVAQEGAIITMNGAPTPPTEVPVVREPGVITPVAVAAIEPNSFQGAVLDITGLDGKLDTPVTIQTTGFLNSIQTESGNQDINTDFFVPIEQMVIAKANIQVDAGGDEKALRIGGAQFFSESQFPQESFSPFTSLDFGGTLTVNSGRVRLEGSTVSTTGGTINVNGSNSLLAFSGAFTSADLYTVNRSNGGRLALSGFWDNSAVTALNAETSAPLSKGNLIVRDELTISGGFLTSTGTGNSLNMAPDSALELEGAVVSTTINMGPASVMVLRAGVEAVEGFEGVPATTLQDATINMGGDSLLVVEADSMGVASLDGTATIRSGKQGNHILAGQRAFGLDEVLTNPTEMTLNVGAGIKLDVTGSERSTHPGLALYYSQLQLPVEDRPVFTIGQLTPEAVAVFEYQETGLFDPMTWLPLPPSTTTLTEFPNPSYIIDRNPDLLIGQFTDCIGLDVCIRFDITQTVNFAGSVMSSLPNVSGTLLEAGVSFADLTKLSDIRFAMQTPTEVTFMQGLNILTPVELTDGRKLINGKSSTVRFGRNTNNQTISNNFENNGTLELQGDYTFSGLLNGTGTLNNSGSLTLSNTSGSVIGNSIINNGSILNTGSYSLTQGMSGTGTVMNMGNLTFGSGTYSFGATPSSIGYTQGNGGSTTLQQGSTLAGNVNINGGTLGGKGTINGNLNLGAARFAPGSSPGLVTVAGDLNLTSSSILDIEIQGNGTSAGVDFDCLVVEGAANLAGQLNLIDISGSTLNTGNEYAFLKANSFAGSFANISNLNTGLGYSFSTPVLSTQSSQTTFQQALLTRIVSAVSGGGLGTGSSGDGGISTVNQILDQAFVPPPTTTTSNTTTPTSSQPENTSTASGGDTTQTQQEQEAVDAANQSTASTTVSQQSNDIELKTTQSNPQRPAAVCK